MTEQTLVSKLIARESNDLLMVDELEERICRVEFRGTQAARSRQSTYSETLVSVLFMQVLKRFVLGGKSTVR